MGRWVWGAGVVMGEGDGTITHVQNAPWTVLMVVRACVFCV